MIKEQFLSYLISIEKISPDEMLDINELLESPRYFLIQAHLMEFLSKEQLEKLFTLPLERTSFDKLANYLASKRFIPRENIQEIREKQFSSFNLLEWLLVEKEVLSGEEFDSIFSEFKAQMPEVDTPFEEPTDAINIFISASDSKFLNSSVDSMEKLGHNVTVFSDLLEIGNALDSATCDLIIFEPETSAADESLEMLAVFMDLNKKLNSVVCVADADDITVPGRLHINSSFKLMDIDSCKDEIECFSKTIARDRTARKSLKSGASRTTTPARSDFSEIADWMKHVEVEYTPDGVMIFIDPKAINRTPHMYNNSNERKKFSAFFDAVNDKLSSMRIEQLDRNAIHTAVWYPWNEKVRIAPAQEPTRDAEASVKLSDDEDAVLIEYKPPTGKGRFLSLRELARIVKKEKPEFFILGDILNELSSSTQPATGRRVSERRDARAEIEISKDQTIAYLTLHKPYGGKTITEKDIFDKLEALKITEGVNREYIKELSYSNLWGKQVRIASGAPAINGENGKIVYLTLDDMNGADTNGNVDHRQVNRFEKVSAGEKIITIEEPTKGVPGVSVHGEVLEPTPGKPVKFAASSSAGPDVDVILGDNVELILGGTTVVSKIDGIIKRVGRSIGVSSVFEVPGDVDYSVGNVDVKGDVIVHGSVLSKFQVKASGNIHILGSVEDAIVEGGGSVFVDQGIYGHEKAIIYARERIEARCIEQAHVFCRGTVQATTNISHSYVVAYNTILTIAPESFIAGGILKAGQGIRTEKLGSPAGTFTQVDVAFNLCIEDEMEELRTRMLKKIAVTSATKKDKSEEDQDDKPEDKYRGLSVKSYNKHFIDWLENYIRLYKNRTSKFTPGERLARYKVISDKRTFPGVWIRIRGFGITIKNEVAGKRTYSLTGDSIRESV